MGTRNAHVSAHEWFVACLLIFSHYQNSLWKFEWFKINGVSQIEVSHHSFLCGSNILHEFQVMQQCESGKIREFMLPQWLMGDVLLSANISKMRLCLTLGCLATTSTTPLHYHHCSINTQCTLVESSLNFCVLLLYHTWSLQDQKIISNRLKEVKLQTSIKKLLMYIFMFYYQKYQQK